MGIETGCFKDAEAGEIDNESVHIKTDSIESSRLLYASETSTQER